MNKNVSKYREDIQGLRGISIIFVMLFHFKIPFFNGGYTGVDIFFVISGYLITNIILKDLKNKNFSYKNFYLNRVRRLAPALLFTSFFIFLISSYLMPPNFFSDMSKSLIASLFSYANIHFIFNSSYFDISSNFRPFLHTWSLSVEEQFYLIWPMLMFFLLEKVKLDLIKLRLIVIMFIIFSLSTSILFSESRASFYIPIFRAYEILIGAYIAIHSFEITSKLKKEFSFYLGIFLIIFSLTTFDKYTLFPSYFALFPCIGCVLLMISNGSKSSNFFLKNKLINYFGNISYPLYLVHWPVFVIGNFLIIERGMYYTFILIIISIIISHFIYTYIENDFRNNKGKPFKFSQKLFLSGTAIFLLLVSISSTFNSGWIWRFGDQVELLNQNLETSIQKSLDHYAINNIVKPISNSNTKKRVSIIGDSQSIDLFNALSLQNILKKDFYFQQINLDENCFRAKGFNQNLAQKILGINHNKIDAKCKNKILNVKDNDFVKKSDFIIISNSIRMTKGDDIENKRIPSMLEFYKTNFKKAKIIYFGNKFLPVDPTIVFTYQNKKSKINQFYFEIDRTIHINENLNIKTLVEKHGIKFFNIYEFICNSTSRVCNVYNEPDGLYYEDEQHWTFNGEKYYGNLIYRELLYQ